MLDALRLPEEQTNERAALTLLGLLDLGPEQRWSDASNPLRGVLAIMEFALARYGKRWKPNTRETVRRFTLHQFLDAGIVVANPDQPDRPINSPAFCYQVPDELLAALRTFGTRRWPGRLKDYLRSAETLRATYASERSDATHPAART